MIKYRTYFKFIAFAILRIGEPMPPGFGTLSFFGIHTVTSTTDGCDETTYYNANKQECGTSKSKKCDDSYNRDYFHIDYNLGAYTPTHTRYQYEDLYWETTYYCGHTLLGTSKSKKTHGDSWESTYYDSYSRVCGFSKSSENRNGGWDTTYHESSNSQYVCSSSSSIKSGCYTRAYGKFMDGWETTYLTRQQINENEARSRACQEARAREQHEERERDAKRRQKADNDRFLRESPRRNKQKMQQYISNLSSWFSETRRNSAWYIALGIQSEQKGSLYDKGSYSAAIEYNAIPKLLELLNDRSAEVQSQAYTTLRVISRGISKKLPELDKSGYTKQIKKQIDLKQLKKLYLSQAGFFNANGKIFNNNYDVVLQTLKERARENPDGASAETLRQFGLV